MLALQAISGALMTDKPSREVLKRAPRSRPDATWNAYAKGLLRGEMERHDVSYKELALLMGERSGDDESPTALITRINRGTFTLAFFLEAVVAMGTKSIDLSHIDRARLRRSPTGGSAKR